MDEIRVGDTTVRMALKDGVLIGETDFEKTYNAHTGGKPDSTMAMLVTMKDILPKSPKSRGAVYRRELDNYGERGPLTNLKIALENWRDNTSPFDPNDPFHYAAWDGYMPYRSALLLMDHPAQAVQHALASSPYPTIVKAVNKRQKLTNGYHIPFREVAKEVAKRPGKAGIALESQNETFKMGDPPIREILTNSQEIALSVMLMRFGMVEGGENPALIALWDIKDSADRLALYFNNGDWEGYDDDEDIEEGETPSKEKRFLIFAHIERKTVKYFIPDIDVYNKIDKRFDIQNSSQRLRAQALKLINDPSLWRDLPAKVDLEPESWQFVDDDF